MNDTVKTLVRKVIAKRHHPRIEDLFVRARYAALYPVYAGREFECPFCGGHFRKLLPRGAIIEVLREKQVIGSGYRANSRCPRCDSYDRERLVYLYLTRKAHVLSEPLRLLHVAPEKNLQRVLRARPNIDYLSSDLDSPLADVVMDITDIQYEANTFDVIICNHVLQDVPEDLKAMSEMYRVLKPGGWAIIQVPISPVLDRTLEDPTARTYEERSRTYGGMFHVRIYARDYEKRLASVGFAVRRYSFVAEFGAEEAHRYGLLTDEEIHIASKPAQPEAGS